MTNPHKRGSAPERAQPAHLRPGSFKPRHKKLGGRKRGTPNAFSADYKESIFEAAFRVGRDGNGKDGILGYFLWLGERYPEIFYTELWINLLPLEEAESNAPEEQRRTIDEINRSVRERIERKGKNQTRRPTIRREGLDRPGTSRGRFDAARRRESEGLLRADCCSVSAAANQIAARTRRAARVGAT